MRVAVLADELTAAGWRLAGADAQVPAAAQARAAFDKARRETELLLVTAGVAAELDPAELGRAMRGVGPLVLVIGGVANRDEAPDIQREVRRALGVEA